MQISILIPSHRHSLLTCSRIVQACSWASTNIEVIVRDNSGNPQKRELLGHVKGDHCNIIFAEPCHGLINLSELLLLAKGDFVFILADDDFCFDHAIASLPDVLDQCSRDSSVVGVTGSYVVEIDRGARRSSVIKTWILATRRRV